ncbi:ComF family protein [Sphingomonas jejuensis]|uniref:ComF family protein n=1 Tax=Sphingomonas jejuensis TaxID=904715 RepID=A0ABX0XK10_9SPHN|nr:ComF family protein [Sphingomonas jejuensis]NJC33559.1 ComF family protein [Sphingomonas jejuensis]
MIAAAAPFRLLLDFALPPRCPGCGAVVEGDLRFCLACWGALDWLGAGCPGCGVPLPATDAGQRCAPCLADPPLHDGVRAVVGYGPIAGRVAMGLKYGRKIGLARLIGGFLAPHVDMADRPLIVPVPLHRWRLWQRGFNQSALIAASVARRTGAEHAPALLKRTRATPVLRGLGRAERKRAMQGAIAVEPRERHRLEGRTVLLVDDVLTSGATSDACVRAMKQAGARRVQLLCWARVLPGDEGGA